MNALRSIVRSLLGPATTMDFFPTPADLNPLPPQHRKAALSKSQFAEVLYGLLLRSLDQEAVEETAQDFKFEIASEGDLNRLRGELFFLNMWLTVRACNRALSSRNRRSDCLDLFHRLVYTQYCGQAEEGFRKWLKSMESVYSTYEKAMNAGHPAASLWVVADLFSRNLFGEVRRDPLVQARIGKHIEVNARQCRDLVKQYDIV